MENIVELPGKHTMQTGASLPQSGGEGCKKKKETAPPAEGAVVKRSRKKEAAYSAFLIAAQAILAGEPAEPGAATA